MVMEAVGSLPGRQRPDRRRWFGSVRLAPPPPWPPKLFRQRVEPLLKRRTE
jgi:hypothetical protein